MSLVNGMIAAFFIGLSSSGHCLLMCGGISSFLSSQEHSEKQLNPILKVIFFHGGRILCYGALGAIFGLLLEYGFSLSENFIVISRSIAALLLIIMGLYLANISSFLKSLESRMAFIWRALQPLVQKHLSIKSYWNALCIGLLWAFLPCGMIYSTVLWASAQYGKAAPLLMLSFGCGTLPVLLGLNFSSQSLLARIKQHYPKKVLGLIIIILGLWSLPWLSYVDSFHQLTMPDHTHHHMAH